MSDIIWGYTLWLLGIAMVFLGGGVLFATTLSVGSLAICAALAIGGTAVIREAYRHFEEYYEKKFFSDENGD